MGNYEHVLAPLKVGRTTFKNRIEFTPACCTLATADGLATSEMIAYYRHIARGGAGIITIGESPVNFDEARGHLFQLNMGTDLVIKGLADINEEVSRYGAKLSVELNHTGRHSLLNHDTWAPTPIHGEMEVASIKKHGGKLTHIRTMDQDMIDRTIDDFANAALRCKKAGLEMAMVHGAQGHLIGQFLSPFTNHRTDRYGGSLENRARFAIEVLDAIRKKVGSSFIIEYRHCADELILGGLSEKESIEFAKMIEDKIDLIHISAGMHQDWRAAAETIQPQYWPHNHLVHFAEDFKKALNIPVVTVGSIKTMEDAEEIIASGKADVVAIGRSLIADPYMVKNAEAGHTERTTPCIRCQHCNNRCRDMFTIRCTVNPTIGRELYYDPIPAARTPKKVVIVGGGPAGMEAGIVAAQRGHEVVLFEKKPQLGGALLYATGLDIKFDLRKYFNWQVDRAMNTNGLTIRLNTEATPQLVSAEHPDALILAVGAKPVLPPVRGVELSNVVWVGDADTGKAEVGHKVAIIGGGASGAETALQLLIDGHDVTMIDMLPFESIMPNYPRGLAFKLEDYKCRMIGDVCLREISEKGISIEDRNWRPVFIEADTVILSTGFKPDKEMMDRFKGILPGDTYIAGDCIRPGTVTTANHSAFNIAVEL